MIFDGCEYRCTPPTPPTPSPSGTPTPRPPGCHDPRGSLLTADGATCTVTGWAAKSNWDEADVRIYVDGNFLVRFPADGSWDPNCFGDAAVQQGYNAKLSGIDFRSLQCRSEHLRRMNEPSGGFEADIIKAVSSWDYLFGLPTKFHEEAIGVYLLMERKKSALIAPDHITVIIPAYNEACWIGQLLADLRPVDLLREIIVVDDGSTDNTAEKVRQAALFDPRVRLVCHPTNRGKGQAIFTGVSVAQSPFLLLLDADLIGLTPEHVGNLSRPVLEGHADMTLGLFRGGRWLTDLSHWLTPWLTGQRCLRAELFQYVLPQAASGYGIETALTVAARQQGWRCRPVLLRGMTHVPSEFHRGIRRGMKTRFRMYAQIMRAWQLARRRKATLRHLTQYLQLLVQ